MIFFMISVVPPKTRLDAAQPPGPKLAPESIGPGRRQTRPGCIWSARTAAFVWRELGRDHAPRDRLAAPQLPEPRRGPDHNAEPAAPDIPAIDADVDSGELIAAQLPQILAMHDHGHRSQVRP
jgi:hypothetical protein